MYNIRDDIGEKHDLAKVEPKRFAELRARLHAWQQEIGAQMPMPNPKHDSGKGEYNPPPKKAKKKGTT